ncbi:MAG: glutamate synthase subunit beta [Deltaproteobacteria bacterium]|nr:glutamate synthase subunit beta [Deltaproteobacteria bacterium]MBW2361476.1 glutamate synthase subunit beta [Deltaproteobacteria bacterium]
MADPRGFLKHGRESASSRPVEDRVEDWKLVQEHCDAEKSQQQASRCMDCGIPFCIEGCPLGNIPPDFNDLVYREKWEDALARLHSTNNFPEFTGLVCPAPCEQACVLGINQEPVTIKQIEWEIIRRGWDEGWVKALRPERRSGRSVAVVGSGPAGLAAAQQLNRAGHTVTLFEKADRVGGLLRYGIPDFKLEKWTIDRRLEQMRAEGVSFQTGVHVGVDLSVAELRKGFDAILLTLGAEQPRDLDVSGRDLDGVHFAMEFLPQQNRRVAGDVVPEGESILATGKHVVILGGGDTGSDCIGTSLRHGAKCVTSLELLPQPPAGRHESEPWPLSQRYFFNVSSSHAEGGERRYALMTKRLSGEDGRVRKLHGVHVEFERDRLNRPLMPSLREVPDSAFELDADLVLLAMGFTGPAQAGLVAGLGVELDPRGNVRAALGRYATSEPGVFAAGDCRRGQSLVVWALWEGREAARAVDLYLGGSSRLQTRSAYV